MRSVVTRCKDCFHLLFSTTPAPECPSVTFQICSPVIGVVTRPVTAGLRQWLAFRHTFFSSFSRSWTQRRGLCFLRRRPTTSLRSFDNCIGSEPQSGSSSSLLFWCTNVCPGQHCPTSLMSSSAQPIPRRLRLTSSSLLTTSYTTLGLSTIGDRAFPVAVARTWNSLPQHVTSAPSMFIFWGLLKAFLFRRSFPWTHYRTFCSACAVTVVIFGHLNHSVLLTLYLLTYILMTSV